MPDHVKGVLWAPFRLSMRSQLFLSFEEQSKPLKPTMRSRRPIGIDLFAGAGGLSLGFEQAGFEIAAAIEIDPIHAAVHEFNFPNCATLCTSVIGLSAAEIRRRSGIGNTQIDVVFGGAPCQGFSMIGKRVLDDPRNRLVHEFVRLVVELEAKYFVFENVKGLTVGTHRRFLQELIASFKEAGYQVVEQYRVLNAADFKVPQNRERLFLIGARRDCQLPDYPEPIGRTTVGQALCDLPNADEYAELMFKDAVPAKFGRASAYSRLMRNPSLDKQDFSYKRVSAPGLLTSSMRTTHTRLSQQRFTKTKHGQTEPVSRFLKLDPDGLCNTLRAGTDSARGAFTSPRPIHPVHSRVITVREAARLHSYPDWFRFHVTKWHGFRQIGNSVPPWLGRAVAACVMSALGRAPIRPNTELPQASLQLLAFDMKAACKYYGLSQSPIATRARGGEVQESAAPEYRDAA